MAFYTVLTVGLLSTNCYIFFDGNDCVVIDPGARDDRIVQTIRRLCPSPSHLRILLTHGHFDHCLGVEFVASAFPTSSVYISAEDRPMLFDARLNGAYYLNDDLSVSPSVNVSTVADGDVLRCGKFTIEVVATPGHTPGSVVYIVRAQSTVFSGDTLFKRGVGRTDLPGGDSRALRKSIREKLFTLPDKFSVCSGHGAMTTVGDEKSR
jgi:glyoxylase-like metal-dependent hydrolase (beta-lactamase superfamily II)